MLTGRGTGLRYFTDPRAGRTLFAHEGIPCNAPSWGLLVAVDLDQGTIRWSVPTGGKQYLVVAPGGHVQIGSQLGDHVIAYTLPDSLDSVSERNP